VGKSYATTAVYIQDISRMVGANDITDESGEVMMRAKFIAWLYRMING
jgi:hypothetical protein